MLSIPLVLCIMLTSTVHMCAFQLILHYNNLWHVYNYTCIHVHPCIYLYIQVGTTETLEKQFQTVKMETTTSHVMQYGDLVG